MNATRFLVVLGVLGAVAPTAPGQEPSGRRPAPAQSRPAAPQSRPASQAEAEARYEAALADLGAVADDKRNAAIEVLRPVAESQRPRLLKALKSPEWRVRHSVLRIYRMAPDPEVAKAVDPLLFDENADVREQAVLAFTGLLPEGWTHQLAQLLWRETDARVLRQILCGLAQGKDLDVVPQIVDFLERCADEYPRKRAASALRSLTGEDFGTDPGKWRRWWNERQQGGGGC